MDRKGSVAKRERTVCEDCYYGCLLEKSCKEQAGRTKNKTDQNTSYDHLWLSDKDVLNPFQIQFFEEIVKSLNAFF